MSIAKLKTTLSFRPNEADVIAINELFDSLDHVENFGDLVRHLMANSAPAAAAQPMIPKSKVILQAQTKAIRRIALGDDVIFLTSVHRMSRVATEVTLNDAWITEVTEFAPDANVVNRRIADRLVGWMDDYDPTSDGSVERLVAMAMVSVGQRTEEAKQRHEEEFGGTESDSVPRERSL